MNNRETEKIIDTIVFENQEDLNAFFHLYKYQYGFNSLNIQNLLTNNAHLNITQEQLFADEKETHQAFIRKIKQLKLKIERCAFFRQKTNEIANLKPNFSKSNIKNEISFSLHEILLLISYKLFKEHFDEVTIEHLTILLSEQKHLKEEYIDYIIRLVVSRKEADIKEDIFYTRIISEFIADYYIEVYFKKGQYKNHKENLQKMNIMDSEDLKNDYSHFLPNRRKKEDMIEEKKDADNMNLLPLNIRATFQTVSSIDQIQIVTSSNLSENELYKMTNKTYQHTFELYKTNFTYGEVDEEIFDSEIYTNFYRTKEICDLNSHTTIETSLYFQSYVTKMAAKISEHFENLMPFNVDLFDRFKKLIFYDFLYFLSFRLLHGNEEFSYEVLRWVEKLLKYDENVQQNYESLVNYANQNPHCIQYAPSDFDKALQLSAVILKLNTDSSIQKQLKKLLLKHYKSIHKNLKESNRRHHQMIFGNEKKEITIHWSNEFAITFIFNFFKDPINLGSISPFLFLFKQEIMSYKNGYITIENHTDKILDIVRRDSMKEENFESIFEMEKEIERIIKAVDKKTLKDAYIDMIVQYGYAYMFARGSLCFFMDFLDFDFLIKKYKMKVTAFISSKFNTNNKDFNTLTQKEQLLEIYNAMIQMRLIDEMHYYKVPTPDIEKLNAAKKIEELEQLSSSRQQELEAKNAELNQLKHHVKELNNTLNHRESEQIRKLTKQHNREIYELKKELRKKDLEIEQLQENQTELYKLREVLFHLEDNENEIEHLPTFDISDKLNEILKKKKVVIIGGHIRLLSMLKAKYPTLVFIEKDPNFSNQVLQNAEHIIFFYNFLNHPLYRKVMSVISHNKSIQWDYIELVIMTS